MNKYIKYKIHWSYTIRLWNLNEIDESLTEKHRWMNLHISVKARKKSATGKKHGSSARSKTFLVRGEENKSLFFKLIYQRPRESEEGRSLVWRSGCDGARNPRGRMTRFLSLLRDGRGAWVDASIAKKVLHAENAPRLIFLEAWIINEGNIWRESSRRKPTRLISIIISLVDCVRLGRL